MFERLHEKKCFTRHRESSYNPTGGNRDNISIKGGSVHSLPVLEGPGIIRHIWMTVSGESPDLYKELELELTFDSSEAPQVSLPIADFFLFGHGIMADVNTIPIQVSKQPHLTEKPYRGGLNSVFPMPFTENCCISFRNSGEKPLTLFFYVDYEKHESLEEPVLHFHATLKEEYTSPPEGQTVQEHGHFDPDLLNRDWKENYVFLDVSGYEGHYVGTGLSIDCRPEQKGKWWEGDDMFILDGEEWPPRIHGTGTEDYFNLAWGFRQVECRPEYGITYIDKSEYNTNQIDGKFSMYRFHINDPIPFTSSILATIEHGHANDCESYYRSVAYWYGRKTEGRSH